MLNRKATITIRYQSWYCAMTEEIRSMRSTRPILLVLSSACTWVSPEDIDARRSQMDDDLDGYTAEEDCNDGDPTVSPAAEETWYDGIDSDCAGDDDFDADGDGFVPEEYLGYQTNGLAGSGELPAGDCNDFDSSSNPITEEIWYDGVDSDCLGDDDFDQDKDGFVPDEYAGLTTQNLVDQTLLPEGDCDDNEPTVHPDAEDIWYDGQDTDCGGEDDFDADQDGHASEFYVYGPTQYVSEGSVVGTQDCNDEDASIHPDVTETWYDGIDSDCAYDSDFDADGDGYVENTFVGLATNGFCSWEDPKTGKFGTENIECLIAVDCEDASGRIWSCDGLAGADELPGGECDDGNPEANPGEIEVLSDGVDRDCDGAADSILMRPVSDYATNLDLFNWVNPYRPRFASNSSHVFLSVVMESGSYVKTTGINTVLYDSGVAFRLDQSDPLAGIEDLIEWQRNVSDSTVHYLSGGHDFVATDEAVFGATTLQWLDSLTRAVLVMRYDLGNASKEPALFNQYATTGNPFPDLEDVNLSFDSDNNLHVLACESEEGFGLYGSGSMTSFSTGDYEVEEDVSDMALSTCDLHFNNDPTGTIFGAQASVDGECYSDGSATGTTCASASDCEDGSGVTWTCEGASIAGLGRYTFDRSSAIEITKQSVDSSHLPEQLVMVNSPSGQRVVFIDPFLSQLVIMDPDGSEWTEDLGDEIPVSLHAIASSEDDSGDMVVSIVTDDGDVLLFWGHPSTGFTTYSMRPNVIPLDAAAWVDPSGELVLVSVTSTTDVRLGYAYR